MTEQDTGSAVDLGRQAGADVKVLMVPNGYGSLNRSLDWPTGSYTFLPYHPFVSRSPAAAHFLAAMHQFAPQVTPATSNMAVIGWLAADMFIRGLREAGPCPTRASFIQGLRHVEDYNADGLLVNRIDFSRNRGVSDLCFSFVQYDGAAKGWHAVSGADPFCGTRLTTPAS